MLLDTVSASRRRSYLYEVMADSPLAYWRLGESSGTVGANTANSLYPLTYVNSPILGVTGAVRGNTAMTSESTKSAHRTNTTFPATNVLPFTMEVWARTTTTTAGCIFGRGGGAGGNTNRMRINMTATGGIQIGYRFLTSTGIDGDRAYNVPTVTINDGAWHHIVLVMNSTSLSVYLDGELVGSSIPTVALAVTSFSNTTVGAREQTRDFPFLGDVDEPAIYNSGLSAGRVAAHYGARNNL